MTKTFTEEERNILNQNPYTLSVSEKTIRHTLAFKEFYWKLYNEGQRPSRIFAAAGYDVNILGERRINGFTQTIKKEHAKYGYFRESVPHNGKKDPGRIDYEKMREKTAIKAMQTELTYLRQEVDFLKKLIRLEQSGK